MEIVYHLNELDSVAKQLIENVSTKTLLFYGEMGVGKTTLIKAIAKQLGCTDDVSSPTFSIVNEYKGLNSLIYHFDLYRVNDIEEAYNFGIEDYLYSNNWSIIEWPEVAKDILPEAFDIVNLKINNDKTRTLTLTNKLN
ncbi:tRNA (adenosine(37)-N6)-threonylcarbamoyltransferase complex ATPase subunit type 1 TsaE [Postechiella marina]|uniref:tRNA threonylcarbamoyladenosine biosynthesis protein TsaE n=1 Tax=Postechiella marina TaxID=943941 RepID=A0ABP8C2E5_9FLAO